MDGERAVKYSVFIVNKNEKKMWTDITMYMKN